MRTVQVVPCDWRDGCVPEIDQGSSQCGIEKILRALRAQHGLQIDTNQNEHVDMEIRRLEDIEEFAVAGRVPRNAVTEECLAGVRQLNETEEIEPFLRAILTDPNTTAHTSTEIADIITHHVTCAGTTRLAGFVNKGKSSPKVTSRLISHQILRLRYFPQINIMILLAVGEIQDDARRDLIQVAEDSGADCLVIDAVDIARLFIVHQQICPDDGRPYVSGINRARAWKDSTLAGLDII